MNMNIHEKSGVRLLRNITHNKAPIWTIHGDRLFDLWVSGG
jgi:hypothetical protein